MFSGDAIDILLASSWFQWQCLGATTYVDLRGTANTSHRKLLRKLLRRFPQQCTVLRWSPEFQLSSPQGLAIDVVEPLASACDIFDLARESTVAQEKVAQVRLQHLKPRITFAEVLQNLVFRS